MNDEERWADVVGFEGFYSVSDGGRIRRDAASNRGTAGRVLALTASRDGYATVGLSRPGQRPRCFRVHRLVVEAFHGVIQENGVVNHLNGEKFDNRLTNLEVTTSRENILYSYRSLGRSHTQGVLTELKVLEIRNMRLMGCTLREIAETYGVSLVTVGQVVHGKTWQTTGGEIREARGTRTGGRVTASQVLEIRRRASQGETFKAIAADVGTSNVNVAHIATGKTWKHVGGPLVASRDGAERARVGIPNHAPGVTSNRQRKHEKSVPRSERAEQGGAQ